MLNRDQVDLIQQEIDGANTPEESAACRSLIEEDTEAKALDAELRHVTSLFDRVGEREPPPHLRQAILDALPRQPRATSGWDTVGEAVQAIVDGFQQRPRFALVASLCVGLVAGFGIYAAVAGTVLTDRSSTSGLAGTFFEPPAAEEVETVDEVPIDVGGGSGRVSIKAGQTVVLVELELDVEQTLEARLTFDARAYGLRGFSRLSSEAGAYFAAEPGLVRVTTSGANTHTFVLHLEGPASPLALSLCENGEEVFTTTLSTRGPNQGR